MSNARSKDARENTKLKACATRITGACESMAVQRQSDRSGDGESSERFRIRTVKNEARCAFTTEVHELEIPPCCPISGNPQAGSKLSIQYEPKELILEVAALREFIDSYQGGRGPVRSMEGMIQEIAQLGAQSVQACVIVNADLVIEPRQRMKLKCTAFPYAD